MECAITVARLGGNYTLANIRRRSDTVKTLAHDVKLRLDIETQARISTAIRKQFPEHYILGEEDESLGTVPKISFFGSRAPSSRTGRAAPQSCNHAGNKKPGIERSNVTWIIDPIDGTVNFYHGLPFWCCSVAAAIDGKVVAGAVYAPEMEECYTAKAGSRATCNGRLLRVSSKDVLSQSLIVTGTDLNTNTPIPPMAFFNAIVASARKARILGSAALDLCAVAAGKADGYFEAGVYAWDVAAAGLIVRQAGGKSDTVGYYPSNRLCFIADNGLIHGDLIKLVNPFLSRLDP